MDIGIVTFSHGINVSRLIKQDVSYNEMRAQLQVLNTYCHIDRDITKDKEYLILEVSLKGKI